MLRQGDSDAFSSINIFRYMLKGSTMVFIPYYYFAEAGESCLSPRLRVQSAPEECNEITIADRCSCITHHFNGKLPRDRT